MYTVTVLVPYVEEFEWLKANLRQQIKYAHSQIKQEIIVADQSNDIKKTFEFCSSLPKHPNISINILSLNKVDAGWPIQRGAEEATGDYFCSLDCDAFPIHPNWLYLPIKLIERYGLSFIGKETGLHRHQDYRRWGDFYHINNYFRISKTSLVKKLAEDVGWMRYENRYKVNYKPKSGLEWTLNCDNGVIAQWYSDKIKSGGKLSFALNKIIGMTNEQGVYGMIIDDLIFHMVFGFGKDTLEDLPKSLGKSYLNLKENIDNNGLNEDTIKTLLNMTKPHHPIETNRTLWNGIEEIILTPKHEIYQFIEIIKNDR